MAKQNWTLSKIVALLNANNAAVERALVVLHKNKLAYNEDALRRLEQFNNDLNNGVKIDLHLARTFLADYTAQLLVIAQDNNPVKHGRRGRPKKVVQSLNKNVKSLADLIKEKMGEQKNKKFVAVKPQVSKRAICNVCHVMKCPDGCCCAC